MENEYCGCGISNSKLVRTTPSVDVLCALVAVHLGEVGNQACDHLSHRNKESRIYKLFNGCQSFSQTVLCSNGVMMQEPRSKDGASENQNHNWRVV